MSTAIVHLALLSHFTHSHFPFISHASITLPVASIADPILADLLACRQNQPMSTPRPPGSSSGNAGAAASPSRPPLDDDRDRGEQPPRLGPIREAPPTRSPSRSGSGSASGYEELHPLHPAYSSSQSGSGSASAPEPSPPYPFDDPLRMPQRPWTGDTLPSRPSSVGSLHSVHSSEDSDDRVHLTADSSGLGLGLPQGHARLPSQSPRRPYDEEGRARAGPLGIITRSPTIRRVSTTLRNASIRVVNIMGTEKEKGYEGLTRLSTNDEGAESPLEMSSALSTPPDPPTPPPPLPPPMAPGPGGLRGRTLGVFSATNPVRVAMDRLLLFP